MKIEIGARSGAPVERVWELLADARGWPAWAPFDAAELEREGTPPPGGVGAIRRFTLGKRVTRESVVAFEPPCWLAYQLLSGLPLRSYRADVTLRDAGEGTEISWVAEFEPLVPGTGWLVKRRLEPFVAEVAERLARRAESEVRA
jgi:Polyketide cyclase / dehydrase and lipid transport